LVAGPPGSVAFPLHSGEIVPKLLPGSGPFVRCVRAGPVRPWWTALTPNRAGSNRGPSTSSTCSSGAEPR